MAYLEFDGELGIQKARIWLDELPSAAVLSNEAACESHDAAVEACVARTPSSDSIKPAAVFRV
jgi:hypothetical protein